MPICGDVQFIAPRRSLEVLAVFASTVLATLAALDARPRPADAAGGPLYGVDIANYQHPNGAPINWRLVKASGNAFAFIKATEGPISCGGSYFTNNWFARDWDDAGAVGLYRGAYHFARPMRPVTTTAIDQARYFVRMTGPMQGPRDLPAVLDLEVTCGLSPPELATWVRTWLEEVTRLTGRRPIIYTGPNFWATAMAGNSTFGAYPLWLARWGTSSPNPLPKSWNTWTFWQTGVDSVAGIVGTVDVNQFNGDLKRLAALSDFVRPFPTSPTGHVEYAKASGRDEAVVKGWAADYDTGDPVKLQVSIDGVLQPDATADEWRPDLTDQLWLWGPFHGFTLTFDGLAPGRHHVCVVARNIGPGADTHFGCHFFDMPTGPPIGNLEYLAFEPGGFHLRGWTLDPDTAASLLTVVTVDGIGAVATQADVHRPDVGAFFPDWGPSHGFDILVPTPPPGPHTLCVYIGNVGPGADIVLGCWPVIAPQPNPIGGVIEASVGSASVSLAGWALDPDSSASLDIAITVDGKLVGIFPTDVDIPVIGVFFRGWGSVHGFRVTINNLTPGNHRICAIAKNLGAGTDTTLACAPLSSGAFRPA
ncbi:MAG: GH25 family lysozyme [Acidimicrobiales bacterium]|nr:GH25 family lysozyme [Acidimicrobiales bacterium]